MYSCFDSNQLFFFGCPDTGWSSSILIHLPMLFLARLREVELDLHLKWDQSFRAMHVPLVDEAASCSCLEECLGQLKDFHDDNPNHTPVVVHIEPRGYNYNSLWCDFDETAELGFELLRGVISEVFCGGHDSCSSNSSLLVLPDTLRGNYSTMGAALRENGWPTVNEMLGKFVFTLNLFPSNEVCRQVYYDMDGPHILFDRAKRDSVWTDSNYSGFIENSYADPGIASANLIIRRRMYYLELEDVSKILVRNQSYPANLFSYDFYQSELE